MRPKMSGSRDYWWSLPARPHTSDLAHLQIETKNVEPAPPEVVARIKRAIAERQKPFRTVIDAATLDKILD